MPLRERDALRLPSSMRSTVVAAPLTQGRYTVARETPAAAVRSPGAVRRPAVLSLRPASPTPSPPAALRGRRGRRGFPSAGLALTQQATLEPAEGTEGVQDEAAGNGRGCRWTPCRTGGPLLRVAVTWLSSTARRSARLSSPLWAYLLFALSR